MANIKFSYLYRDASNNKQYGEAVFTNTGNMPLADIEKAIRDSLHEGAFFKAEMVDLETVFFNRYPTEDDHPWHEFFDLIEADEPPYDPAFGCHRDIAQFIQAMQNGKLRKWDPESQLCPVCGEVPSEACEAHHDQLLEGAMT